MVRALQRYHMGRNAALTSVIDPPQHAADAARPRSYAKVRPTRTPGANDEKLCGRKTAFLLNP